MLICSQRQLSLMDCSLSHCHNCPPYQSNVLSRVSLVASSVSHIHHTGSVQGLGGCAAVVPPYWPVSFHNWLHSLWPLTYLSPKRRSCQSWSVLPQTFIIHVSNVLKHWLLDRPTSLWGNSSLLLLFLLLLLLLLLLFSEIWWNIWSAQLAKSDGSKYSW